MLDLPSIDDSQENAKGPTKPINKRAMNRESSRQLLESRNIEYCTNNDGIHLIVTGNGCLIDFWPGKGKWTARDNSMSGFGVFNLIDMIESGLL
ncbi:hypothetical protein [Marinobacterium sedimentorum]|uniref:hypothetical protein n=1 Tax=Marinobacterium sedimentorum TaxID=2927804 RepID=UPI0020C6DA49|nr:hypothetical protein [Marinobacterium sedimentorum]MCP8687170.1 hypothetical protein [Marinobacterium sedimentorum]